MRTFLFTLALIFVSLGAKAQDEYEYRMEIGVGAGMVSYEGDFNGSILKNMRPSASFILKRVLNPYMALKLDCTYGTLAGNSADVKTWYPELADNPIEFKNTLVDFGVSFEYNFWPYGTGREYRGAKRITPFVFVGLGGTYVDADGGSVFTANIPLGVGVKYKIGKRLNLGLEWAAHFSLSDKLDGVEDPYGIVSNGLFKNTDCYSMLKLTLTYSFMAKCKICNKDD